MAKITTLSGAGMHQPVDIADEELLEGYDKIAAELLARETPNEHYSLPFSNSQLVNFVCTNMGWTEFDLVHDTFNFEQAYKMGNLDQSKAYMFLAFLRKELYNNAMAQKFGPYERNVFGIVFHDYWHHKLLDKVAAMTNKVPLRHDWIH